jgi:DNA invertase Pin-like site-specific DNA recombinase
LKAAAKARHEDALDAVRQRREKVRALFCAGIGQSEIARQIGANAQMVGKDVKLMGLSRADYPIAKPVSEKPTHKPEAIERRRLVGEMRAEGRKVAEIAQALGCSFAAVQRDMTALGITTRTNSASHVGNPAMVRQVKAMRARKMSIREIAEALKIAKSTVVRMYQVGEAA